MTWPDPRVEDLVRVVKILLGALKQQELLTETQYIELYERLDKHLKEEDDVSIARFMAGAPKITNQMVADACAALGGAEWQASNASLWWDAKRALCAALGWEDVSGDIPGGGLRNSCLPRNESVT